MFLSSSLSFLPDIGVQVSLAGGGAVEQTGQVGGGGQVDVGGKAGQTGQEDVTFSRPESE